MAIYPYEVLVQLYEEAVYDQPWSFLFINLKAPKENMFPYALKRSFR